MTSGQAKKIFFRNIPIVVMSAVFFAVLIGLTVKSFSEALAMGVFPFKKIWVFHQIQNFSEYVFIFFLIVSYEYFAMTEKPSIKEALRTTPIGFDCLKRRQLLVMTGLASSFFVVFVIFSAVAAGRFGCLTAKFFYHIVVSTFLDFFLIGILATLAGAYIAAMKKKVTQYIALLAVIFLTSPIFTSMFPTALLMTDIANIYPFTNLFDIFPPNQRYSVFFSYGNSVLPYRFEVVLFWCLLTVFLMSLSAKGTMKNRRNIALSVAVCLCFTCCCIPESTVKRNNDPAGADYHDFGYYKMSVGGENLHDTVYDGMSKKYQPFSVKSCKLDFFVANYLYGKAELELDGTAQLTDYFFTLYHGYKVTRVENEKGSRMTFNRAGDFLHILNDFGAERLTVYYRGSCPKFYSNLQGIALPGDLAYYPVAGLHRQFDNYNQSMLAVYPETMDFEVRVRGYAQQVFCNLPETGRNSFKGTSNGVTLLSGFYEEYNVDGSTFVCSPLDGETTDENLKQLLSNIKADGFSEKIKGKKIMILPSVNQLSKGSFLDDHIVSHGSLSNFYTAMKRGADTNA